MRLTNNEIHTYIRVLEEAGLVETRRARSGYTVYKAYDLTPQGRRAAELWRDLRETMNGG